jgi:hypothetical protein
VRQIVQTRHIRPLTPQGVRHPPMTASNRHQRLGRVYALVCATLFMVACGSEGARQPEQVPPAVPPQEAARQLQTHVAGYLAEVADAPDRAVYRTLQEGEDCSAVSASSTPAEIREKLAGLRLAFATAVQYELRLPPFARLVERVSRIRTSDPGINQLVRNTKAIYAEARKLNGRHFDFCAKLHEWRQSGWEPRVEREIENAPFSTVPIDLERTHRVRDDSVDVIPHLESLGLSHDDAQAVVVGLAFF